MIYSVEKVSVIYDPDLVGADNIIQEIDKTGMVVGNITPIKNRSLSYFELAKLRTSITLVSGLFLVLAFIVQSLKKD